MSESEDRKKEPEHQRGALKCNDYPDGILRDVRKDNNNESRETLETSVKERSKKIPNVIQYIKGFLKQLRRVFGKYGIPTYFKPTNTCRQLLVKPKDPTSKENMVIPVHKINVERVMQC